MATEWSAAPEDEAVVDTAEAEDAEIGKSVRYTLASYGADYPVDGLVKRLARGDIFVPPFQRRFVWTHKQASSFVESLLLGLPVPGVFLYKDPETQRLMVVDGQQRLLSLGHFYAGVIRGKEFSLKAVTQELEGVTYRTLREEDRRRLDDAVVHATVFGQETPKEDRSSVYLIFERLNTGGTPLVPQEIRACVYRGPFNDLLVKLAALQEWQELYGAPSARGKDQELILRFFALLYNLDRYERPMSEFLNKVMDANRQLDLVKGDELERRFRSTVQLAVTALTPAAFRPERNLNAALTDAILVGLAQRLLRGGAKDHDGLQQAYQRLIDDEQFTEWFRRSTTDPTAVKGRIDAATRAFANVK